MRLLPRWFFAVLFALPVIWFTPQTATAQPSAGAPINAQSDNGANPSTPAQVYTLPPEKLAKAQALDRIRNTLDIVSGVWGVLIFWLLLATRASAGLEVWLQRQFKRRWMQGLCFFAVLFVATILASLPIDAYGHHASVAYGISVQNWGSWLVDQAKSLALGVVFLAPLLLLFNWIVRRWPRRYWLVAWLVTLPIMIASIFVAPLFEPVFNKYEPLAAHHAGLVAQLELVVARTGTNIPPNRMFLMKASEKTNGLNAYVDGIGATKRIVVWDTTAGRIPDDEVEFIFGHESGHYVLNHIPKQLAGAAVGLFFVFWACARLASWLIRRFGKNWGLIEASSRDRKSGAPSENASLLSTRTGFVVLIFAISILGFLLEPVGNTFSRHFEHEADVYGQEAIHGLVPDPRKTAVAGFQALGEAWLEDPNPNPLIEFWLYNHPSVKNRASFAARYDPWVTSGRGQFFER